MKPLIWLRLHPEGWPAVESFEYSMRRMLLSISVNLTVETSPGVPPRAQAEIEAKIPLKGAFSYRCEAEASRLGQLVSFTRVELTNKKRQQSKTWLCEDGHTVDFVRDGGTPLRLLDCQSAAGFAEVLGQPFLVPAFHRSWQTHEVNYAGLFMNEASVSVFFCEPVALDSETGVVDLNIRSMKISNDADFKTLPELQNLDWSQARNVRGEFDTRRNLLSALEFSAPVLGTCRLELTRHSKIKNA